MKKQRKEKLREQALQLVSMMTLEEKMLQMMDRCPAIERLNIPKYTWWNESLHGIARGGVATVFPQAIGLAATFNSQLLNEVATAISTEGRARHHEFFKRGDTGAYKGISFWSPNINIFRDPRWGRGHETYGEDPYLTGKMGVSYIKGIQEDDEDYLKAAACAKHFAVHSGPEGIRHEFNSIASKQDMYETYFPAFEKAVKEGQVEMVMGAYNRLNGVPCCGNEYLLNDILREKWGFTGHVVSDCGGLVDFHTTHNYTNTPTQTVALAIKSGCDMNCGNMFLYIVAAVQEGLLSEEDVDISLTRLMETRLRLGLLGDNNNNPYKDIPYSLNNCDSHAELNLETSRQGLVLLKNDGILPLNKKDIKNIAVIGPNARSIEALRGNYAGTSTEYINVFDAIKDYLKDTAKVYFAEGCDIVKPYVEICAEENDRITEAQIVADLSDVIVLCLGINPLLEGEQGDAFNSDGSGDKMDLELPNSQKTLFEALLKCNKPIILVNLSGSALILPEKEPNAIIQGFYPGALGGKAIAELIFGEFSPSGRLPVTFYRTTQELPDFENYSMQNRTYRYMENEALFPFGYGLSYTEFQYSNLKINSNAPVGEDVKVTVDISNIGNYNGFETVQLYISYKSQNKNYPKISLKGFTKVFLEVGQSKKVEFILSPIEFSLINEFGDRVQNSGEYIIYVGGSQPDKRSEELTAKKVLCSTIVIKGENLLLDKGV